MADREDIRKIYSYGEMSNKVQQADRSLLPSRMQDIGVGEVESLRGRDLGRMGDRVSHEMESEARRERPAEIAGKLERAQKKRQQRDIIRQNPKKRGENILTSTGVRGIEDLTTLNSYQPTHEKSRASYESLLNLIRSKTYLGNQPTSILTDAANEIIAVLKDVNLRDPERHDIISRLLTSKGCTSLGGMSKEQFSILVNIGKAMDDYFDGSAQATDNEVTGSKQQKEDIDDDMGVAVVFDDSEEENEDHANKLVQDGSEPEEDEVVDAESESSSEDENVVTVTDTLDPSLAENESDDDIILEGKTDSVDASAENMIRSSKRRKHSHQRILTVHEIDAHYLQRQLSRYYDDASQCADIAQEVLDILDISREKSYDLRECENKLLVLLESELFDLIKLILNNRVKIWACIALKRAKDDTERDEIESVLKSEPSGDGMRVWEEIHSKSRADDWTRERIRGMTDSLQSNSRKDDGVTKRKDVSEALDSVDKNSVHQANRMDLDETLPDRDAPIELDLNSLAFRDGAHTMSNKKCDLPVQTWRAMKKGYEEVHVPAVRSSLASDEKLIAINDLPAWTQDAFKGMDKLNRIQSKMCDVALRSSENILLCAPTGAGKTNIAMLAMLNILGQYRKVHDTAIHDIATNNPDMYDLSSFKIVYVAPMKALVQEVVKNFSKRLELYGISVKELSGDSSLTRQQIADTQLLVTTPEKWDIVTRQGEGRAYTQLVKLVIIDEIHLLHDDRGPVLESIVSRVIRQVETNAEPIRLVGLSATLPNYFDVATFLRVKPDKGLFFFDQSYRPVPLQMQYIGIMERSAFKRYQLQNEICYEKVLSQRRQGNQVLIFVHSRAETGKTCKILKDFAIDRDELSNFVRDGSASQEILREEAATVKNSDLKEIIQYGFAIHHAGMVRSDRELVEDLFADGHIGVLCSTATLAWGVNLPAHAVIIKGTQIYDPSKGSWVELSPLDVLQMLGRAGRPQYDSEGEGIIMTSHSELPYYLSLTNVQLPVESQLVKSLADHLNAEIVLGNVQSITEAVEWLSYSFLYVRMLRNPTLYGIVNADGVLKDDPTLKRRRLDLVHTAACILEKNFLIRYDKKSGALQSTPMGRIASQYYISHCSMAVYNRNLRPNMTDIELLRVFSLSGEFSHITVREEEKLELAKLSAKVPIPVKENPNEPLAKVNILLQAYISRLKLEGFALMSDMAFIQQSAARIMRALFEIALRHGWSNVTKLTLAFANMVSHRIWRSQSPLRQFGNVPEIVARKLERKSDIEWSRYFHLTPSDLGELIGVPKMGRTLHKLVHQFPQLELSAQIQPITRSMLRIELNMTPDFEYDTVVHGFVQLFHILVEDVNGENILHHEVFSLKSSRVDEEQTVVLTVPVLDPLPPLYFIRVISDRWLHSEAVLPVSFEHMILPPKFPPPTELLDLQPLSPSALGEPIFVKLFPFKDFNPIQTQTFHELFKSDRNALVCAASGSGKTVCAEFAIIRMLYNDPDGKCVYVAPRDEIVYKVYEDWSRRFGAVLKAGQIALLTGDVTSDLSTLAQAKIILSSVRQWDNISRRWRQRKIIQSLTLFIIDDLHFLGGEGGPTIEIMLSRMRYISSQKEQMNSAGKGSPLRLVGLGAPIANAREVGEWMGVPPKSLFNFSPQVRPTPLEIFFQSFDQSNFSSRLLNMAKPVYNAIKRHSEGGPTLIFVPSRRQAQLTAIDMVTFRDSLDEGTFLGENSESKMKAHHIGDLSLNQVVSAGVGFIYDGMNESDRDHIVGLYRDGALTVLVCPFDICWKVQVSSRLVVIMDTEFFDGKERRYLDYPISNVLNIMGKASRPLVDSSGKCVILCHTSKKERLKKLLYDPLPIESHLDRYLHDHINSEIVTKGIGSMQDAVDYITWTFLYRRLSKNPNYYNLQGTSNVHLSEHISEMVETVLGDLEESKCCQLSEEGEVSPLNLGMICAYYYIQYTTIELIASSVGVKTKTRGVLEILAAASEFGSLPVRQGDEKALKVLSRTAKHQLPDSTVYSDANTKALILLQCHFSRTPVSVDLQSDQTLVLKDSLNIIQAIVDVISSNSWLKPALAAMEVSQMIVQGLWNKDNVLLQIPHFTNEIIHRLKTHKSEESIGSVFDILSLDDDIRNDLLQLSEEKMADVALFCNSYPNVDVVFSVLDPEDITSGETMRVQVKLERIINDENLTKEEIDRLDIVVAPFYPREKREGWWIIIGDTNTNSLFSLKKVGLKLQQTVTLEFLAPDPGDYNLTLFCMSDSYLGCDQEYSVPISVAAGESDDYEDNDDVDEDGEDPNSDGTE